MKKTKAAPKRAEGLLMRADRTANGVTAAGSHWSLQEIQKLVGGYFKIVRIPGDTRRVLLVDEDGRQKGLTPNPNASEIAGQMVVGDVLMIHRTDMK